MRSFVVMFLLVIGYQMSACALDIPVPGDRDQRVQVRDDAGSTSTVGTVVGGSLIAAALLLGGLWLIRKRGAASSV